MRIFSPLSTLSTALLVIFITSVVAGLLPLGFLDPAWQLRLVNALVDQAPLALMGFGLIYLESRLYPDNEVILNRSDRFARLAVIVCLGYCLLIPLQIQAALRVNQSALADLKARNRTIERDFQAIRQNINAATAPEDLRKHLLLRGGPALTAAEQSLPLKPLRRRLLQKLEETRGGALRQNESSTFPRLFGLLTITARNLICTLAIALAFSAVARRRGCKFSLLEELSIKMQNPLGKRSNHLGFRMK